MTCAVHHDATTHAEATITHRLAGVAWLSPRGVGTGLGAEGAPPASARPSDPSPVPPCQWEPHEDPQGHIS